MRKLYLPLLLSLLIFGSAIAKDSVNVTFNVDLRIKVAEKLFLPGTDGVSVRGSFMNEAGYDGDWFPSQGAFWLTDEDADTIYSLTLPIDSSSVGTLFEYKFQINDAIWEGDPNRSFTLTTDDMNLPTDLFDRDDVITLQVTNTLNFSIDLSEIYGSGSGYFDPDSDEMTLQGLDWVGAIVIDSLSERVFTEDPFSPGIFHTTMVIQGVEGDETKWKCKANPEDHFYNWGWEITPDYWYTIMEDGYEADLPIFTPNIFPVQQPLTSEVNLLFQVDMNNAVNFYTGEAVDPSEIEWVGLKGQNSVLGSWGGDWLPSDTLATDSTQKTLHLLFDDGLNGDKVGGDNIYSVIINFPVGNDGGPGLYKYAVYYPGADTVNGGYHPLDNEMQGTDHWVNIMVDGTTEVMNYFGSLDIPTTVKDKIALLPESIHLGQNYPNPFNPTTTINYYVPKNQQVELAVFNILGQKVATLVNSVQKSGEYSASFEASHLASGLYFYRLSTSDQTFTKKMMLMK